jgi:hypothetical protein
VIDGEVPDPLGLEAEQQDERAWCPDMGGLLGEAAVGGPCQEVADAVAALDACAGTACKQH